MRIGHDERGPGNKGPSGEEYSIWTRVPTGLGCQGLCDAMIYRRNATQWRLRSQYNMS